LSLAPYQEVAKHLRDQILSGELAPGAAVPSESELIETFRLSRRTIQRAIEQLRIEGMVVTSQGARTTVRRRPSISYVATGENFRRRQGTGKPNDIAEAEAQGYRGVNKLLAVEEVPAPADVAERLRMPAGDPVIMRYQVNLADSEPMKVMRCYYPLEFAAGTALAEFRLVRGGVANLIEAEDGPIRRRIDRFVEDIELRMPHPEEAEQLAIPPGVPVARIMRTLYDPSGRPLEVLVSLLPGDRYLLRYVIDVPEKP
jgi:GntR family transcriptional regulator